MDLVQGNILFLILDSRKLALKFGLEFQLFAISCNIRMYTSCPFTFVSKVCQRYAKRKGRNKWKHNYYSGYVEILVVVLYCFIIPLGQCISPRKHKTDTPFPSFQSIFFKLRSMTPCCLCQVDYDVDLDDDDVIQVAYVLLCNCLWIAPICLWNIWLSEVVVNTTHVLFIPTSDNVMWVCNRSLEI